MGIHVCVYVCRYWSSQSGLDEFYASPEFQRATPRFAGQLAGPPDERVFNPV
jgi:quinol monooxygenase YgiN